MSNGLERLFSPSLLDIFSPIFAFTLVVVLPACFGVFVIVQILTGKYSGEDRRK